MKTGTAALVFDFDGTIVDTETPVYESWKATFERVGAEPVPLDVWVGQIGQADDSAMDLRAMLCDHLGVDRLPSDLEAFRRATRDEMLAAEPIRAGVVEWIQAAAGAGLSLAVASSSSSDWVVPHLVDRGLDSYFGVVSCADPPVPGKPDPAVYLAACEGLGADPAAALAIEDSPHGVSAAIAAGMRCLAVPGPMTRLGDFSHATAHSLVLADLAPADWL